MKQESAWASPVECQVLDNRIYKMKKLMKLQILLASLVVYLITGCDNEVRHDSYFDSKYSNMGEKEMHEDINILKSQNTQLRQDLAEVVATLRLLKTERCR